jgi:signal transduction histidine kinase
MEPTTFEPRTLHDQYTVSIITPAETFSLQGPWHLDPEDGQPLKEDLNRLPLSFDLLVALNGTHYLVHPEDVMALQDVIARLRTGKSSDYHCRIIHSSGYTRILHGFATLQIQRIKMTRALREDQDVTSRQQSLQQKHELETMAAVEMARTAFFSNVSHEFRTPLTLLLNPLEEMLEQTGRFSTADTQKLQMVHRNALRLQKLVNTLLDLSRIEAGRAVAAYRPTRLSSQSTSPPPFGQPWKKPG